MNAPSSVGSPTPMLSSKGVVKPSFFRAVTDVFTMNHLTRTQDTIVALQGAGDYASRVKDVTTNIGFLSAFMGSIVFPQMWGAPELHEKFDKWDDDGNECAYKVYVTLMSVAAAGLMVSTVISVGLLGTMAAVPDHNFARWVQQCNSVVKLPCQGLIIGTMFWLAGTCFVCPFIYDWYVGCFQLGVFLSCVPLVFWALASSIYAMDIVEATVPSTAE
mmetsp:Transcript_36301/g.117361  ORF Transcript_36301/g.117361 Transcript_36301/m.117361 type:complete len:217 (-) Transcript_36301:170-820(-)